MSKRTFYIYIEICHIDIYEICKVGISIYEYTIITETSYILSFSLPLFPYHKNSL